MKFSITSPNNCLYLNSFDKPLLLRVILNHDPTKVVGLNSYKILCLCESELRTYQYIKNDTVEDVVCGKLGRSISLQFFL
jgi:hypothetical protein